MPMIRRWDDGTGIETGLGVVLEIESPLWDMPPEQAMAALRRAKELYPYLEHLEYLYHRLGTKETKQLGKWELAHYTDDLLLMEAMASVKENPFASPQILAVCADVGRQFDEYYTRQREAQERKRLDRTGTGRLRVEVLKRDQERCRYCGGSVNNKSARLDHVIPYSLGGLTEKDNLATSCHDCNAKKAGKTLQQAGMALLPIPE